MSIRWKIILIVVPLIVATLLLTGVSSYFAASNGMTKVAKDFLGFKAQELQNQAESQWRLLVDNNLSENPEMVSATKAAVEGYARSIVRSATELIVAVGEDGSVQMGTSEVAWQGDEQAAMAGVARSRSADLVTVSIGGRARVGKGFWFEPFKWYLLVTEERSAFYDQVNQIALRTVIILVAAIVAGVGLVLGFASYLTRPLTRVAGTMREIISTNDLSKRVVVEYHDEIGALAQTFNLMVDGLEKAYRQIKGYALKAAVARTKERKIRDVFQQYVPADVIGLALKGEAKPKEDDVCIMFSHISDFSAVTKGIPPDELVQSLEPYFRAMVDTILGHDGMVDKYITDAVMAFFGAPVKRTDDAVRSVRAGIEMTEALWAFNARREAAGQKPFHVSVGINQGKVTVGTIGTEDKMNYTVIGDAVNLASRLSGLTRVYKQDVIFSESLYESVKGTFPCRLLDSVAVKGRKAGVKIFTARKNLSSAETEGWGLHEQGMALYYARNFIRAAACFRDALKALPEDPVAAMLLERSRAYERTPPPEGWDGVEVMTHK
ncbi:MAG TPA: adenylate/guanylate cyclase domain-containing protein [Spirochaetia bacterium]|nr:adenylate/guanylate cyclase domain-containing protein [Spirochaetia bacterium]